MTQSSSQAASPVEDTGEEAVLSVRGVSILFGGVRALTDVSFSVRPGETMGLIGPNGAGKSTLVNCIVGLYRPTSGEVWLNDARIDGVQADRLASRGISRTFQNVRLFSSLTALENVMMGCYPVTSCGMVAAVVRASRQRREEQGIRDKSMTLLDDFGLRDIAGKAVRALPYAQQKGVEICRALAAEPQLLLLDEPAAGMSGEERQRTALLIRSLADRKMSILLIEHDVSLVMSTCHRIAVLDHGVLIAHGSPDEVRANPDVISAYLGED